MIGILAVSLQSRVGLESGDPVLAERQLRFYR